MRHGSCSLALVIAVVTSAGPAARAEPRPGLAVFVGPRQPSPVVTAARDRAAAAVRAAGLAWIDRSRSEPEQPAALDGLRTGIDAYDELRWDDALAALDRVADQVWQTGGDGLATARLADLFLYRALVQVQRGDATRSWDDLIRAAVLAPTRTLDPLRFPTRAVEAFDRARQAVAARPQARITVTAEPGCRSWIDGGPGGSALVFHGEHLVRVECPGRAPWGERVVVAGDLTVAAPAAPAPAPPDGELAALARRRGAGAVLVVVIADDGVGPPTAVVRVVAADGKTGAARSLAVGDPGWEQALDRALADALAVPATGGQRRSWKRSPWLWAGVGALAAAAVIVPLTAGGGGRDTATVRPTGWTW